jgi:peptidoglycan-N-acetylglucosamine deacetylase
MFYLVKTPWWLKSLYPKCHWQMPRGQKHLYLTFDDGPHPDETPFVLDALRQYGAKASFFCIGKNVLAYPALYERIKTEGHTVGNHTQHHVNGWKVRDELYLAEVATAAQHIHSGLFRPPYGRIRWSQLRKMSTYKIIMWSVLSGDFDTTIDGQQCLNHVLRHTQDGSIVVFHDSAKASPRLRYALPKVLEAFSEQGFSFVAL